MPGSPSWRKKTQPLVADCTRLSLWETFSHLTPTREAGLHPLVYLKPLCLMPESNTHTHRSADGFPTETGASMRMCGDTHLVKQLKCPHRSHVRQVPRDQHGMNAIWKM